MAWYDEAVFYHIYPLGLLNAPKTNDYGEVVHRLRDLDDWIEHISNLGFNALYIGPLFESVGHGYETTDYYLVDRRLGDNEDLKNLVKSCHSKGIKVILDAVFNHTGRDFFAFKDLKEKREASEYKDWYVNVNFYGNNEFNDGFSYDNWGGYNILAKLNQWNEDVKNYIYDVIRFWVKEFDIDGLRLDAADVLDFNFIKGIRHVANEVKTDFWLMGEVIHGEYNRWVNNEMLNSVTNYHLNKALWSGCNDYNFFEIAHTVKRLYEMGGCKLENMKLYSFADNHDVERIINKIQIKQNAELIYTMLYTLPGIPSVYYGSEFSLEGKKENGSDDKLRPHLNYEEYKDEIEKNTLTRLIANLNRIHTASKALCYGEYREILLTNRQFAYSRTYDDSCIITVLNLDDNPCEMSIDAPTSWKAATDLLSDNTITVENGKIVIFLNPHQSAILRG